MVARLGSAARWLVPLAFGLAVAAVYAVERVVVGHLATVAEPGVLAAAVTLDLAVLVPAAYYGLLVRGRGWPALSVVPVFLLSLAGAALVLPDEHEALLQRLHLLVPLVEVGVLALVAVKGAAVVRAYRAAGGDAYERLRVALGTVLPRGAGVLAYELALLRYAVVGWRERPPEGEAHLGVLGTSGYGPVLVGVLLAAVAELVAGHVLLQRLWGDTAALAHLGLSGYALLWLWGDYQALRLRPLRLGADGLAVHLGLRWDVCVPLDRIAAVRRLARPLPRASGYLDATPLGRARYLVELTAPVRVTGPYGLTRTVERLGIAVDEPARFERRLVDLLGPPLPERPARAR